jgi:hypothetical protein
MPSPLRRSGSGLLQNPEPGLLPSPKSGGFGPLGPSRVFFRRGRVPLRYALQLRSSSLRRRALTRRRRICFSSSGGLRGRDSHPPVQSSPSYGHTIFRILTKRPDRLGTLSNAVDWPSNVWMGVSIENRRFVPRRCPASNTCRSALYLGGASARFTKQPLPLVPPEPTSRGTCSAPGTAPGHATSWNSVKNVGAACFLRTHMTPFRS